VSTRRELVIRHGVIKPGDKCALSDYEFTAAYAGYMVTTKRGEPVCLLCIQQHAPDLLLMLRMHQKAMAKLRREAEEAK